MESRGGDSYWDPGPWPFWKRSLRKKMGSSWVSRLEEKPFSESGNPGSSTGWEKKVTNDVGHVCSDIPV